MTSGPELGHCGSIRVDYDQFQEVCSTANLSLPTSVVDLICLPVRSVPAISDCLVVNNRAGALEEILETRNEPISALGSRVASKDAEIFAKVAQVNSLEGRIRIAEEGGSLRLETIREHGSPLYIT